MHNYQVEDRGTWDLSDRNNDVRSQFAPLRWDESKNTHSPPPTKRPSQRQSLSLTRETGMGPGVSKLHVSQRAEVSYLAPEIASPDDRQELLAGPWQRPWQVLMLPPGRAALQRGLTLSLSRGPEPGPPAPLAWEGPKVLWAPDGPAASPRATDQPISSSL